MAIYSNSLNVTNYTTGTPAIDLKSTTGSNPKIMEVGIELYTATASVYGLGRPQNVPVQTSPTLLLAETPTDVASQSSMATTWSVAPTIPLQFLRRISIGAAGACGYILTFPRGLTMGSAGDVVLWNLATNSNNINAWWITDE